MWQGRVGRWDWGMGDTGIGQVPGPGWHSLNDTEMCHSVPDPCSHGATGVWHGLERLLSAHHLLQCSPSLPEVSSQQHAAKPPLNCAMSIETKRKQKQSSDINLCVYEAPACFQLVMRCSPVPSVWLSLNIIVVSPSLC